MQGMKTHEYLLAHLSHNHGHFSISGLDTFAGRSRHANPVSHLFQSSSSKSVLAIFEPMGRFRSLGRRLLPADIRFENFHVPFTSMAVSVRDHSHIGVPVIRPDSLLEAQPRRGLHE